MASAGKTLQFTNDSKKTEKRGNIKKMTLTAMLAAIAVILMYMEIPVPFMPGFIKLDISRHYLEALYMVRFAECLYVL